MNRLLKWLMLRVEGDPDPDPADPTLDDVLSLEEPDQTPAPVDEPPDEPPELKTSRQRNKDLEAQLEAERAARKALESRPAYVAPAPAADADYEREERELSEARAKGASPEQMYWLQFKIDTDRKGRSTEKRLSQVAMEAQDAADRLAFRQMEASKPNFYKRYATKVENLAAEYRAKGQVIPREAILKMLVGDDMVNGTIKPKTAKPAAAPADTRVPRGQPQQVRSDVTGRASASEREKRRARLANQQI